MDFSLGRHEHANAGRLGTAERSEPCAFVRLVEPAVLGPSLDQPAVALEDLARRFDLNPCGCDLAAALLDQRPRHRFDGNNLFGHAALTPQTQARSALSPEFTSIDWQKCNGRTQARPLRQIFALPCAL
jgi:hypothetical protein